MTYDPDNAIAMQLHTSTKPLFDWLTRQGIEVGSAALVQIAPFLGSATPNLTPDARVLCVSFDTPVEAWSFIRDRMMRELSEAVMEPALPLALFPVDGRAMLAFLGAIGMAATVH